jgi:hypothetical protein
MRGTKPDCLLSRDNLSVPQWAGECLAESPPAEGVYLVPESSLLYRKVTVDKLFISGTSLPRDSMELARLVVSSGFRPTFLVASRRT